MSERPRLVPALERATFRAESPIRKVVRSNRLNPLPHAGTISVFLLVVVVVTGVYITLFFSFGFEASHRSVERMADHPIQSLIRTVHRYASAGLVLTTLVHAWRIFVAGRFRGPRAWRWTTGVAALAIVWLAGVTGYWLVWDQRAEALNRAVVRLFGDVGWVSTFLVRNVYGPDAGTGWGVLFAIWLAHLLLTAVIGWFIWRHVRRTRFGVVPPRHWMALMGGALIVVSLVLPADLLGPADPSRLVGDLPLDPFVLFLLPPLLSGWAWLGVAVFSLFVAAALVAPHLVRSETPVVTIDEDACTGCELCVIDCPYVALSMHERSDSEPDGGTQARRPVAVVDPAACVGCGICIGSCSFGAMTLPGFDSVDAIDPDGRRVVIACSRHLAAVGEAELAAAGGDEFAIVEVACTGMIHANAVGALTGAGAVAVQVVGCAPGDCAYGLGNTILDERLTAGRAPHVANRFAGVAVEDWVAPGELFGAMAHPGRHPSPDAADRTVTGRRLVGAGFVVLASIAAVAMATQAPYAGDAERSGVLVVVDHAPGAQIEGQAEPTGSFGTEVEVVVRRDGDVVEREPVPSSGTLAIGLVDVELDAGATDLTVQLVEGDDVSDLFAGAAQLDQGRRLVVTAVDLPPPPGASRGREVFEARSLGSCDVCHSVRPGDDGVGPSLAGVADRAADRVAGLDAEAYLRESIVDPDAYIVDGYRAGQMLAIYEDRLSPDDLDAVVQYLLTLRGEVSP
jgi:ferredoxin/mono/diheme cytochrome c family protein